MVANSYLLFIVKLAVSSCIIDHNLPVPPPGSCATCEPYRLRVHNAMGLKLQVFIKSGC